MPGPSVTASELSTLPIVHRAIACSIAILVHILHALEHPIGLFLCDRAVLHGFGKRNPRNFVHEVSEGILANAVIERDLVHRRYPRPVDPPPVFR